MPTLSRLLDIEASPLARLQHLGARTLALIGTSAINGTAATFFTPSDALDRGELCSFRSAAA